MSQHHNETEWTDDEVQRLHVMWADGLSTQEIGRRLGRTKNMVVGKARRSGCQPRPTPINNPGAYGRKAKPQKAHRAGRVTIVNAGNGRKLVYVAVPPPAPKVAEPPPKYGKVIECCWPVRPTGRRGFLFCETPTEPGKPYCPEHCKLAYVKPRPLEQTAHQG